MTGPLAFFTTSRSGDIPLTGSLRVVSDGIMFSI